MAMSYDFDVVVAGAGPSGTSAARTLAEGGAFRTACRSFRISPI